MSTVRSIQRGMERQAGEETREATCTLGQLRDSWPALNELSGQPLHARTTFRLGKMLRKVKQELDTFEESRKSLCEKHGTYLENEDRYDINKESKADFDKEFKELCDTTVELTMPVISVAMLEETEDRYHHPPVSGASMMILDWLIQE